MSKVFAARGLAFWLVLSLLGHLPLAAILVTQGEEEQWAGDARPFTIQIAGQETAFGRSAPATTVRKRIPKLRPTTVFSAPPLQVASLSIDPISIDPIPATEAPTSPAGEPLPADNTAGATTAMAIPRATPVIGATGSADAVVEFSGKSGTEGASSGAAGSYTPPSYAVRSDPVYPSAARKYGEEGEVLLQLQIAADGTVALVKIERSSGYEDLDRAATDAVQRWRFHPARRNGLPVAETVRLPLRFRLQAADPN